MKPISVVLVVLSLTTVCLGYLPADLDSSGIVDFYDFAIFSRQWLKTVEDQNEANPKFEFNANSAELSFARDSIAYDHDFNEYSVNVKRVESVCVSSRAMVTINKDVDRIVHDVDGDMALCGYDNFLYSTSDGESFGVIVDVRSDTPLDSGGKFSDYTVSEELVESLMVMADGSWLLCTGRALAGIRGHLFRSTNKGISWSVCKFAGDGTDFQLGMGFVPEWTSIGISDNEVIVGEYGYFRQENNPRRIYYSDDYGATWTMIIDVGPAGWKPGDTDGQHCHGVTFGIEDTNTLYASYGDGAYKSVRKFACSGDKKNPADWTEVDLPWKQFVYTQAPVYWFNDGSYIYVGRDSGYCPTLWRFDAQENREDVISFPVRPVDWTESTPYKGTNGDATYMFGMAKHNGIFYAAVGSHQWQEIMAGIYVSTDGKHWVCAYRVTGEVGPYTIVGYANGYIWGTYKEGVLRRRRLFKFPPVNAKVVSALRVERGITNIANSVNQSCFNTGVEGWTFSDNVEAVVWTDTEHLIGDGCVKVVSKEGRGDIGRVFTKSFSQMGGLPNPGDYICFSAWIKATSSWPEGTGFSVNFENATNVDQGSGPAALTEDWQRVVTWSKCIGVPGQSLRGKFWMNPYGYTGDSSDLQYYIDGLQVVYFPDLHYSGAWQKGGTPRADESAAFPLTGLSCPFALSFNWRPDCASNEWHADCPIATIVALDGSYLELFWEHSASEFSITDGTYTEIINSGGMGVWELPEMIKFAIVCDGNETNLYIENSVNGIASVIGFNGCTLTDLPAYIVLASNNDRTTLAFGLFCNVRAWDSELSLTDVKQVFDTVDEMKQ